MLIYVLKDPRTGEIRYVGKTNDLKRRFSEHLHAARHILKNQYVYNWISKLLLDGMKPLIETIEDHLTEFQAIEREIYWIAEYRSRGSKLTNLNDGGLGFGLGNKVNLGRKLSKEIKRKMSISSMGKNRQLKTDDHKRKLSKSLKGRKLTKEQREKISKAQTGRPLSEEHKRNISAILKGRIGQKHSEEIKRKMSESHKEFWRKKKGGFTMKVVIAPNGQITTLASENHSWLVAMADQVEKRRASHVEPVNWPLRIVFKLLRWATGETGKTSQWTRTWQVQWRVNLEPSGGPVMQPFADRSEAISAEIEWLLINRYGKKKIKAAKFGFGYGMGKQKLMEILEGSR